MDQKQFDEIVDLLYHIYGNDTEGGLTSRADLDAQLAAYTREMGDDDKLSKKEIDQIIDEFDPEKE